MKSCTDLSDYINNLAVTDERIEEVLKTEMVWDMVGSEWAKVRGLTTETPAPEKEKEDDIDDSVWEKDEASAPDPVESEDDSKPWVDDDKDLDDEDLLKELAGM